MKNIIRIFLLIALLSNTVFAQKGNWTLGFNVGTKGDVWQKGKVVDRYGSLYMVPFTLTLELNVSYGFTDRLFIQTGLAYVEKNPSIKRHHSLYEKNRGNFRFENKLSQSVQIPVRLKYAYPIKRSNFYFTGSAGLVFDIIADDSSLFSNMVATDYTESIFFNRLIQTDASMFVYGKKINFLIHAGIGIEYHFKNGLTLSLCGEYNIGTRIMGEISVINQIFNDGQPPTSVKPYTDKIYLKGDYWNVGIGISYTFKKKEKKQVEL